MRVTKTMISSIARRVGLHADRAPGRDCDHFNDHCTGAADGDSALSHRQVSEAARILQGALVGARDSAIHNNAPSGIRLLPDPAFPIQRLSDGTIDPSQILAASRIIPIEPAPSYIEGLVNLGATAVLGRFVLPYPGDGGGNYPYFSPATTRSWRGRASS